MQIAGLYIQIGVSAMAIVNQVVSDITGTVVSSSPTVSWKPHRALVVAVAGSRPPPERGVIQSGCPDAMTHKVVRVGVFPLLN